MSARIIEWDGEPFALLVESEAYGKFLVPPVVLDEDEKPVEGREVLAAVAETGVSVMLPVVRRANPGVLAEIDRRMAHLSAGLGVPIGPRRSTDGV